MDDPNMYAYGDHYPDDSDQPLPLPPEGHPLRKLGQRLTELLDEDHWAECERLLLEGWEHDRIDRKTGADWRQNSSLEIWFPFTAKELARWKRAAETNIEENVRLRALCDRLGEALDQIAWLTVSGTKGNNLANAALAAWRETKG